MSFRQLPSFPEKCHSLLGITSNISLSCDAVKIYYDNGQIEVSRILASVFSALIPNSQFRKVLPKDYKLFQVADLICSMELIRLKMENHQYSHSEELFFGKQYELKRNYLRIIQKKEWR